MDIDTYQTPAGSSFAGSNFYANSTPPFQYTTPPPPPPSPPSTPHPSTNPRKRRAPTPPTTTPEPLTKRLSTLRISPPPRRQKQESMDLDPSHVVYVNSLSDESDLDSEPEVDGDGRKKLIFIPDIEKELSRIPEQVLRAGAAEDDGCKALVLYRNPVAEERGREVRKAVLRARREREREEMERAGRGVIPLGWKAEGEGPVVEEMEGMEDVGEAGMWGRPEVEEVGDGDGDVDMDAMEIE